MEPSYPVAFEDIVSLYRAVDKEKLQQHKAEIIDLFDEQKTLTERASRYVSAAGSLLQDSQRIALSCTDTAKVRAYAQTLSRRYLPPTEGVASEKIRLLSACTLHGNSFLKDTVFALADRIVALDDPYGAVGRTLLFALREQALAKGYSIITCYCPMNPNDKIDHLFIPSLHLCFTTCNSYHTVHAPQMQTIHYTRFCNSSGLKLRRQRLRFNEKAAAELYAQAFALQTEIKDCHDRLEQYYVDASDFRFLDDAYRYILSLL